MFNCLLVPPKTTNSGMCSEMAIVLIYLRDAAVLMVGGKTIKI